MVDQYDKTSEQKPAELEKRVGELEQTWSKLKWASAILGTATLIVAGVGLIEIPRAAMEKAKTIAAAARGFDPPVCDIPLSLLPLSPFPLSGLFKRFLPGDEPSLRVLCARSRDEHAAFGSAVADFDVSIAYANVIVEHVPKDVSVADLRSVHPDAQQLFAGAK